MKTSNVQQTLSFATSGPDARGSQIFVNLSNNDGLDEQGCASPNAACARGAVLTESPHRAVLHRSPKCSTGSPNSRRSRAKSVNQPRSPTRRLPRYDGCTASLHKQNPVLLPRRLLLRRPLHIAGTRQPVSCKRPARQTQLHRPRSKGMRFLGSSTLPPDCPSMLALQKRTARPRKLHQELDRESVRWWQISSVLPDVQSMMRYCDLSAESTIFL